MCYSIPDPLFLKVFLGSLLCGELKNVGSCTGVGKNGLLNQL